MQVKQLSRDGLRRLCALFLLLLSVSPCLLALGVFNALAETSLPLCCRTHGEHKCFMRLAGQEDKASTSSEAVLSLRSERCPCCPICSITSHSNLLGQPSRSVFAIKLSTASTPATMRISTWTGSSSLANCKRGPPSPVLRSKHERLACSPV